MKQHRALMSETPLHRAVRVTVAAAQAVRDSEPDAAFEAEVRVGLLVDAVTGQRWRGSNGKKKFVSSVGTTMFLATFQAMYADAVAVSKTVCDVHSRYHGANNVRQEQGNGTQQWVEKTRPMPAIDICGTTWCDVRVALSKERRVSEPACVRDARRIAGAVRRPREHSRSLGAFPSLIRQRNRRSLRFASCPAWRLDFTQVENGHMTFGNSGVGMEHMLQAGDPTHEIGLEYVGPPTFDPALAADQACALLHRVATVLGKTSSDIHRRLDADRLAREMSDVAAGSVAAY